MYVCANTYTQAECNYNTLTAKVTIQNNHGDKNLRANAALGESKAGRPQSNLESARRRKCRVESLPAAVVNIDVDTTNSRQKASYRLLHTHTRT